MVITFLSDLRGRVPALKTETSQVASIESSRDSESNRISHFRYRINVNMILVALKEGKCQLLQEHRLVIERAKRHTVQNLRRVSVVVEVQC